MSAAPVLAFDPLDNPMHLSKVGNWVMTFLSPQGQTDTIQLALTYVIPRQVNEVLQPRRIVIHQTAHADQWQIDSVECYDSQLQQDILLDHPESMIKVLEDLISEFKRYDVNVTLMTA